VLNQSWSRRQFLGRSLAATVAIPGLAAILEACSNAPSANGKTIKNLVVAVQVQDIRSLDPDFANEGIWFVLGKQLYDQLVTTRGQDVATLLPDYASKWSLSSDGLTYVFDLNPKLKYADGSGAQPSDLVFSFNRMINLKGPAAYQLDGVQSVTQTGPNQVTIVLKEVNVDFLNVLTNPSMSVIQASKVRANGGTDAADASTADHAGTWLNDNSVGTGPFVLDKWVRQQHVIFKRNPNYWGQPPAVEQITFQFADINTQKDLLIRGDAHIAANLTRDIVADLRSNNTANIKVLTGRSLTEAFMAWSVKNNPIFASPDIWDAVRYAIDYDGLKQIYGDGGERVGSCIPNGLGGALAASESVQQDLDKSKAALAKAGHASGFSFVLTYATDRSWDSTPISDVAQKVQADLARVGIKANLRPVLFSQYVTEYRAGKPEAIIGPAQAQWPGWTSFLLDYAPGGNYALRGQWKPDFSSSAAQIADLVAKAKSTPDQATQFGYLQQAQRMMNTGSPYAWLFSSKFLIAVRSDVISNLELHPTWIYELSHLTLA